MWALWRYLNQFLRYRASDGNKLGALTRHRSNGILILSSMRRSRPNQFPAVCQCASSWSTRRDSDGCQILPGILRMHTTTSMREWGHDRLDCLLSPRLSALPNLKLWIYCIAETKQCNYSGFLRKLVSVIPNICWWKKVKVDQSHTDIYVYIYMIEVQANV